MDEDQNTFSGTAGACTSREACALCNSYFKSALLKSGYEPWPAYHTFPFVEASSQDWQRRKKSTTGGVWNNLLFGQAECSMGSERRLGDPPGQFWAMAALPRGGRSQLAPRTTSHLTRNSSLPAHTAKHLHWSYIIIWDIPPIAIDTYSFYLGCKDKCRLQDEQKSM